MSEALELARGALGDLRCWVVGGAVRDALRGAPDADDVDLIIDGDVAAAARALARTARAAVFELSDDFGAWRVVGSGWQVDLNPLRGGTLAADLGLRDFTVNAIAQPLAGGELIDPFAGAQDLGSARLRLVGAQALNDDPLRALRLVRLHCELGLLPDADARAAAQAAAPALAGVAQERVFAELKRILMSERVLSGLALASELGLSAVVLPELEALRGIAQNRFHHLDVYDHTLEVLNQALELERDPGAVFGEAVAAEISAMLSEPLADQLPRAGGLRLGALMHDIAKPATREQLVDGGVTFIGHDKAGAQMSHAILGRLRASERLATHVGALARDHLRLGFLVHRRPLSRHDLYIYLDSAADVALDVTLLSVADRLATRGDNAKDAIERHLALAREVIEPVLRWRREGRAAPLIRGDQLAAAIGIQPGPRLGELLAALAAAQFAGEVASADEAIAYARGQIA